MFAARISYGGSILYEGFEYANHDGATPTGWVCDDDSWVCGYLEKDHKRIAHTGYWYAHTNSTESWMFMPMSMNTTLKYRFNLWAVSDGEFQLEIWAGNEASPGAMTQMLLSDIVDNGYYAQFSSYVDELASDYEYFGIHAVRSYCDDCILTIDDINVEMVEKYAFTALPSEAHTTMQPGEQASFECKILNEGYETLTIYMTPYSEFFTEVHMFVDGQMTTSFPIVQDEIVVVRGEATLRPDVEPGSTCWVDVMFTIDCGCATTMFTLWATVETDNVEENHSALNIYPNPSTGMVTVEGNGIVTISNMVGQTVVRKEVIDKETITLDKGIYFINIGEKTEKVIIR